MNEYDELTRQVIGLAIEVHRTVGPGLLESVYAEGLCIELEDAGVSFQHQVAVPVAYKNRAISLGFRADIVVAGCILIEVKAVAALIPAHQAQILSYLRMGRFPIGLLMNFNELRLVDGLRRFVAGAPTPDPRRTSAALGVLGGKKG